MRRTSGSGGSWGYLLIIDDIWSWWPEPVDDYGIEHGHGVQLKTMKQVALLIPEGALAPRPLPGGLKQGRTELLGLVDQKGQHHQHHKHFAQVFFAETEVVFEVIALIFQGVECFVLDFPATATPSHQDVGVIRGNRKVGYPGKVLSLAGLGVVLFVEQQINFQIQMGLIERGLVEKPESMRDILVFGIFPTEGGRGPLLERLRHIVEQQRVIARFGSQDEMHVVLLQIADVGAIGTKAVLDHDHR